MIIVSAFSNMKILLVSIIGFSFIATKRIPNFAGPYRVVIRGVHNKTDYDFNSTGKSWVKLSVTHPRLREPQYVWGLSVSHIDFDDTIRVEMRMSKWANNEWKKNAFVMKLAHACTDGTRYGASLLPFYFGDDAGKCPIKKGFRVIRNQTAEWVFPVVPVFPYGRWLFTVAGLKGNEVVAVVVTECETVPKL